MPLLLWLQMSSGFWQDRKEDGNCTSIAHKESYGTPAQLLDTGHDHCGNWKIPQSE